MSKKDLHIIGAGGHAKVIADIAKKSGHWNIAGFVVKDNEKTELD